MSEVVSANEAAHRSGLSEKTVRRWIAAGKLTADKRGRAHRVTLSEVAALSGHDTARDRGQKPDSGQTANIGSASPTADSTSAMSAVPELVALVASSMMRSDATPRPPRCGRRGPCSLRIG